MNGESLVIIVVVLALLALGGLIVFGTSPALARRSRDDWRDAG